MDVAGFATPPSGQHLFRVSRHRAGVRGNSFAVKGRLAKTPFPQPVRSFACQQAFPKKPAAISYNPVFDEILVVRQQHGFNMVGMIEKVDVDPPRTVVKDVAELAGPRRPKSQRGTATQRKNGGPERG